MSIQLTSREVYLWFSLIIMFAISMLSFIGFKDDSFFRYLSFAGTLTSIVLAVVAIIYSFLQGSHQSNILSKITNQSDQIQKSNEQLAKTIQRFDSKLIKIDAIKSTIDSNFPQLNKDLEHLKANFIRITASPTPAVGDKKIENSKFAADDNSSTELTVDDILVRFFYVSTQKDILNHVISKFEYALNHDRKLTVDNLLEIDVLVNYRLKAEDSFSDLERSIESLKIIGILRSITDFFFALAVLKYDLENDCLEILKPIDADYLVKLQKAMTLD